jgi:hypothetical protein
MTDDLPGALRDLLEIERTAADTATADPAAISRRLVRRVGRRRAARAGGGAAAGLALVAGAAVGVQALDHPAPPAGPAAGASPSPAVTPLVDAASSADQVWSNRFALVVTAIMDAYPDDYATSVVDDAGAGTGWIGFRDAVPPAAQAAIDTLPGSRAVGGLGYTFHEVTEASGELLTIGTGVAPDAGDAAAWAEGTGASLVLVYRETEPGTAAAAERRRQVDAGVARVLAEHPALTVEVRTSTGPVAWTE